MKTVLFTVSNLVICFCFWDFFGCEAAMEIRGSLSQADPSKLQVKCYFSAGAVEGHSIMHERTLYEVLHTFTEDAITNSGNDNQSRDSSNRNISSSLSESSGKTSYQATVVHNKSNSDNGSSSEDSFAGLSQDAVGGVHETLSQLSSRDAAGVINMYRFNLAELLNKYNGTASASSSAARPDMVEEQALAALNEQHLVSSAVGNLVTGVTFTVYHATCEDAGVYRCRFNFSTMRDGQLRVAESYDQQTVELHPTFPRPSTSPSQLHAEELETSSNLSVTLTCAVYTTLQTVEWLWEVHGPYSSWSPVVNGSEQELTPPLTQRCHKALTSSLDLALTNSGLSNKYRCVVAAQGTSFATVFDLTDERFLKRNKIGDIRRILSVAGWTILIFIIFIFVFLIATSVAVAVHHTNDNCQGWCHDHCPRCCYLLCRRWQRRWGGRSRPRPGEHPRENDARRPAHPDDAQNVDLSPQRRRNKRRRDPSRKSFQTAEPGLSSSLSPSLCELLEIPGGPDMKLKDELRRQGQDGEIPELCDKQTSVQELCVIEHEGRMKQSCDWWSSEHREVVADMAQSRESRFMEPGGWQRGRRSPIVTLNLAFCSAHYQTNAEEGLTDSETSSKDQSFQDPSQPSSKHLESRPRLDTERTSLATHPIDPEQGEPSSATAEDLLRGADPSVGVNVEYVDLACDDKGLSMDSEDLNLAFPIEPSLKVPFDGAHRDVSSVRSQPSNQLALADSTIKGPDTPPGSNTETQCGEDELPQERPIADQYSVTKAGDC